MSIYIFTEEKRTENGEVISRELTAVDDKSEAYEFAERRREELPDYFHVTVDVAFYQ